MTQACSLFTPDNDACTHCSNCDATRDEHFPFGRVGSRRGFCPHGYRLGTRPSSLGGGFVQNYAIDCVVGCKQVGVPFKAAV